MHHNSNIKRQSNWSFHAIVIAHLVPSLAAVYAYVQIKKDQKREYLLVSLVIRVIDWPYFHIIRGYNLVGYDYFYSMKPALHD